MVQNSFSFRRVDERRTGRASSLAFPHGPFAAARPPELASAGQTVEVMFRRHRPPSSGQVSGRRLLAARQPCWPMQAGLAAVPCGSRPLAAKAAERGPMFRAGPWLPRYYTIKTQRHNCFTGYFSIPRFRVLFVCMFWNMYKNSFPERPVKTRFLKSMSKYYSLDNLIFSDMMPEYRNLPRRQSHPPPQ